MTNEKRAINFLKRCIENTKFENKVFIAGGFVRDEIMGLTPKDIDLVINMPNGGIEFTNFMCKNHVDFTPVVFETFGTAMFKLKGVIVDGFDLSEIDIECVMTRKEEYESNSRNPITSYGSLKDDVLRRDFTVNSLLKNVSNGNVLDLTGHGVDDIKKGIIRTSLEPDTIFNDDPLRMLRAIRFTVKYNWELPDYMVDAITENSYRLSIISMERIQSEFNKMMISPNPVKAIELLRVTGLLKHFIPELLNLVGLEQNKHHKDDAYRHTLSVVSLTSNDLITRLSSLLHDIGKYDTATNDNGVIHFINHENVGVNIATTILKRLKYSTVEINNITNLIKNHMGLKIAGDDGNGITDKSLRKFRNKIIDMDKMLNLIHADNMSHSDDSCMPNQVKAVKLRLENLSDVTSNEQHIKLPLNGNDVMSLFNVKGAKIGTYLRALEDAYFENPNLTYDESVDYLKNMSSKQLSIFEK